MIEDKEKQILIDMLRYFDSFCNDNGLTYFIGYGTLLGALRHKGFIPWDDDIDVILPRGDYDRYIELMRGRNDHGFRVVTPELEDTFMIPFAKLTYTKSHITVPNIEQTGDLGVYIDVFPLDGAGNNYIKAVKHKLKCVKKKSSSIISRWKINLDNKLEKNPMRRLTKKMRYRWVKLFPRRHWRDSLMKTATKYDYDSSDYVGVIIWNYGKKEIMKKEIFEGPETRLPFEGIDCRVPPQYRKYLENMYGDYMTLPPEDKRYSKHGYSIRYDD